MSDGVDHLAGSDLFVSVLAVVRDQAAVLRPFVEEVSAVLEKNYANFEILLIDNGSRDETATVAGHVLTRFRCVRFLRLSRAMVDETATMAGLDAAIGDFVVCLHPDFDPPLALVPMVEQGRAGSDVVLGVDTVRTHGLLYRALRRFFLVLTRWLVGIELVQGTTGFRVLSRQAVNALTRVRQRRRHFDLIAWDIGLATTVYSYRGISRSGRQPAVGLGEAIRRGTSVIIYHSMAPLRMASVLGGLGSFLSFLYSLYVVTVYLIKKDVMPGWTTLSLQTSGLFFLVFVILTLLGEYLGRVLDEASERPLYHLREEMASNIPLADEDRRNVLVRSDERPTRASSTDAP